MAALLLLAALIMPLAPVTGRTPGDAAATASEPVAPDADGGRQPLRAPQEETPAKQPRLISLGTVSKRSPSQGGHAGAVIAASLPAAPIALHHVAPARVPATEYPDPSRHLPPGHAPPAG